MFLKEYFEEKKIVLKKSDHNKSMKIYPACIMWTEKWCFFSHIFEKTFALISFELLNETLPMSIQLMFFCELRKNGFLDAEFTKSKIHLLVTCANRNKSRLLFSSAEIFKKPL